MGLLSDLATAATTIHGFDKGVEDVKDVGQLSLDLSQSLGQQAVDRSQFKPFNITSGTGNIGVGAGGSTALNLSPELSALTGQLRGSAAGLFQNLSGGTAEAEQRAFDRLEALASPARERDALALEERMFNQGRTGVRDARFGGTPEQLAFFKAIEESRNQNAVNALNLGRQDRVTDANIGTGLFEASFRPEQRLLEMLGAATPVADIAATGDRQGASLSTALAQTGLQGKVQSEAIAGNLQQQQIEAIAQLLQGGSDGMSGTGGLIDQIIDLFG